MQESPEADAENGCGDTVRFYSEQKSGDNAEVVKQRRKRVEDESFFILNNTTEKIGES